MERARPPHCRPDTKVGIDRFPMHARAHRHTTSRHKSGTILANETVHLPGIVGRRRGDPRPRRNCEHCLMRGRTRFQSNRPPSSSRPCKFIRNVRHDAIVPSMEAECKNFVIQGGMEGTNLSLRLYRTDIIFTRIEYM